MKTICTRCLLGLAGCISCAVLAEDLSDSPTRAVAESYQYEPEVFAKHSTIATPEVVPSVPSIATALTIPATDQIKPNDKDLRGLADAMAQEKKLRAETLFTWNLPYNLQINAVGRPNFQELEIPWSPMSTSTELSFSTRVQVRIPILSLVW